MPEESLTPEERGELLKLLRDMIAADRFPLSQRIRVVKTGWRDTVRICIGLVLALISGLLLTHVAAAAEAPQLDPGLWRMHVLRARSSDNNPVNIDKPQTNMCVDTEYAHDPGKLLAPQPVVASFECERTAEPQAANTTIWHVDCRKPEPFSTVIAATFDSPRHFNTTTVMTVPKLKPEGETIELTTETEYNRIGDCEK
jgi:hypothetical protein